MDPAADEASTAVWAETCGPQILANSRVPGIGDRSGCHGPIRKGRGPRLLELTPVRDKTAPGMFQSYPGTSDPPISAYNRLRGSPQWRGISPGNASHGDRSGLPWSSVVFTRASQILMLRVVQGSEPFRIGVNVHDHRGIEHHRIHDRGLEIVGFLHPDPFTAAASRECSEVRVQEIRAEVLIFLQLCSTWIIPCCRLFRMTTTMGRS